MNLNSSKQCPKCGCQMMAIRKKCPRCGEVQLEIKAGVSASEWDSRDAEKEINFGIEEGD